MRLFLLFFSAIFSLHAISQSDSSTLSKGEFISECIEFRPNILIKHTEVSIADYFGYVFEIADDLSTKELEALIPKNLHDSCEFVSTLFFELWLTDNKHLDGYKEKWYRNTLFPFPLYLDKNNLKQYKSRIKLFLDMPITGLSFEDVQKYLSWLEARYNEYEYSGSISETHDLKVSLIPIATFDSLLYYTKWSNTLDSSSKHTAIGDSVNALGCHLYNFKGSETCPANKERIKRYNMHKGPVEVFSYNPNILGFYNVLGNVAEMTSERGIAYGGHYEMYAKECLENPIIKYSDPNELIGFRYMVTAKLK